MKTHIADSSLEHFCRCTLVICTTPSACSLETSERTKIIDFWQGKRTEDNMRILTRRKCFLRLLLNKRTQKNAKRTQKEQRTYFRISNLRFFVLCSYGRTGRESCITSRYIHWIIRLSSVRQKTNFVWMCGTYRNLESNQIPSGCFWHPHTHTHTGRVLIGIEWHWGSTNCRRRARLS